MDTSSLAARRTRLSRHYKLLIDRKMYMREGRGSSGLQSQLEYLNAWIETQFLAHYFNDPPRWRLLMRRFSGKRILPDFCVIGPPKAGTSDLAVHILLHPNVVAPLAKEFWSNDPESWRIYYPTEREMKRHAQRHGLARTPYLAPCLNRMEFAHMLSQVNPNMKVVITLRDPVQRVFSQWKWQIYLLGTRRAAQLPFLASFPQFVDTSLDLYPDLPMFPSWGWQALQTSIYWAAVKFWMQHFGARNVLVLDAAEYFRDRDQCLRKIQEFVGLPYFPTPAFADRVNESPPLNLPPPDEQSMTKLRNFYRPYNERLWDVIGKQFAWE